MAGAAREARPPALSHRLGGSVKARVPRTGEPGPLREKGLIDQAGVAGQRGCWVEGQEGCMVGGGGLHSREFTSGRGLNKAMAGGV